MLNKFMLTSSAFLLITVIFLPCSGSAASISFSRQHLNDTLIVCDKNRNDLQGINKTQKNDYDNRYQFYGEELLDRIHTDFYYAALGLYAEIIDNNGTQLQPISYIWPASHMLRALKNGYRTNNEKYFNALRSYSIALDRYISEAGDKIGYAAYPGDAERFYDDNGLFIIQFAEIYDLDIDSRLLQRAVWAYDFNNNDRDEHWGLPQHENQLDQGMFYSMAVNQTGLGAALLYQLTGEEKYLSEAITYYEIQNDPTILLKDPVHGLFHQFTFFQNGQWSYTGMLNGQQVNGSGFRAYQTTHVAQLALQLYLITGENNYLEEAETMVNKCIDHWYTPNQGLNEISFWGGNDLIDALIDVYNVTADDYYLDVAKDIIDFLIDYGRDELGYYPSDYNDAYGRWNLDRRGETPETILMMGQAAAASAMLRVSIAVEEGPVTSNRLYPGHQTTANDIKVFPTILAAGTRLNIQNNGTPATLREIRVFSPEGRLIHNEALQTEKDWFMHDIIFPMISPGIYIVQVITSRGKHTAKLIIQ